MDRLGGLLGGATHTYDKPGRYTIAVKVIDIFGNDTMMLVPVTVEVTGVSRRDPYVFGWKRGTIEPVRTLHLSDMVPY
ncbi:MAG: hypothetical protein OJF51_001759 [Nitrospira sp.]|nr:MAG: hypothetical protein OJF51_001759 [Nitrospira sp.]